MSVLKRNICEWSVEKRDSLWMAESQPLKSEQVWCHRGKSNFSCALRVIVLRAIDARADRIFLHHRGIEWLQATADEGGVFDTAIQPKVVLISLQNHRHAPMNIRHKRVWPGSQDCARFDDFTFGASP